MERYRSGVAEDHRKKIITNARSLEGAPASNYRGPDVGISPETGFTCSGFVRYVLELSGVSLGSFILPDGTIRPVRHANEMWDHFGIATHGGLPGELVFFSRAGLVPTHVGIVIGDGEYIHSPGTDNRFVERQKIVQSEIARLATGRQLYTVNPIGFKVPTVPYLGDGQRYYQVPI